MIERLGERMAGVESFWPRTRKRKAHLPKVEHLRPKEDASDYDGGVHQGQRLSPGAAIPKPPRHPDMGQTEHLIPGFSIHVPLHGNAAPYLAEAMLRARKVLPALIRPHKAKIPHDPRGTRLLHRARPIAAAAVPSTGKRIDPGAEGSGTDPSTEGYEPATESMEPMFPIQYRTVSFEIEMSWFAEYLTDWGHLYGPTDDAIDPDASEGKVSSVNESLDLLWPEYRAAASGDEDAFQSLLGCYNLPKKTDNDNLFWKVGFGPANQFYLHQLNLLYTYADLIAPQYGECENYTTFVRDALSGRVATSNSGIACKYTILAKNGDKTYVKEKYAPDEDCESGCKRETYEHWRCGEGYKIDPGSEFACDGINWDFWTRTTEWSPTSQCWSGLGASDSSCSPPDKGCLLTGWSEKTCMWTAIHPARLSFFGFVSDWILFFARLALDRARDGLLVGGLSRSELADLHTAAQRLARYVLRIAADEAMLLIHEMGHLLNETRSHCGVEACMCIGGKGWLCQVRALLGLPREAYAPYAYGPRATMDYRREDHRQLGTNGCGADVPPVDTTFNWVCDVTEEGSAGMAADFCSTTCLGVSPVTTYCLDGPIVTTVPSADDSADAAVYS